MPSAHDAVAFSRLDFRARDPQLLSQFYEHALGLESSADSDPLGFSQTSTEFHPSSAGLFHVAFLYPDRRSLAHALLRLLALGVTIQGASDHGVSEAIYLEDPEGNGVEIYADRPQASWTSEDGIISMDTRALDLDDLLTQADPGNIDVARSVPQNTRRAIESLAASLPATLAAPTGISIGHVHLRAFDLQQSERFWTQELGFDVTSRYRQIASFLSSGGYHHHIAVNRFSPWTAPVDGAPGLERIVISRADGGEEGSFVSPEGIVVELA